MFLFYFILLTCPCLRLTRLTAPSPSLAAVAVPRHRRPSSPPSPSLATVALPRRRRPSSPPLPSLAAVALPCHRCPPSPPSPSLTTVALPRHRRHCRPPLPPLPSPLSAPSTIILSRLGQHSRHACARALAPPAPVLVLPSHCRHCVGQSDGVRGSQRLLNGTYQTWKDAR